MQINLNVNGTNRSTLEVEDGEINPNPVQPWYNKVRLKSGYKWVELGTIGYVWVELGGNEGNPAQPGR